MEGAAEGERDAAAFLPAIRFTPADLTANRRGELTVDQQLRLEGIAGARTRWANTTTKWTVAGLVALFGVGLVIELRNGAPAFAFLTFTGLAAFFAVAVVMGNRSTRGLRNRRLSMADGVAELAVESRQFSVRGGRYTAYELQLRGGTGRRVFPFNDQASLDEMPAGQWLRLYFLETTPFPVVLSYEVVPRT
jgi:hypothetical protein